MDRSAADPGWLRGRTRTDDLLIMNDFVRPWGSYGTLPCTLLGFWESVRRRTLRAATFVSHFP